MEKVDPTLWRDVMNYLRRHHGPVCRQWFEELEPIELDKGLLRVRTSTAIQQNYLQKRCLDHFNEAALAVTGHLVGVRFENEPEPSRREDDQPNAALKDTALAFDDPVDAPERGPTPDVGRAPPPPVTRAPLNGHPRPAPQPRAVTLANGDSLEQDQMILSPDYSFENFITGPNNQLAYAASVAVANQPGIAYNPLFIHGGVGLGKTHLLQAVCQEILTKRPETQILYVSCDAFMNQFIACVQSGQMNEFRHRYRYVDMLVIDDIHFLGSRERTQEEFFHTFNELYQQNKQIVLSSDAAPNEIPHLEDRLVSRFQWGLVAPVTQPHYETRVAILRAKAYLRGVQIPNDVIALIANRVESNARELEGAITTLQAHAALTDSPIDLDLARKALGEPVAEPRSNQVTLQKIIDVVTRFYSVKLSDLQSRRRHKSVTEPRQVCMWLARKWTRFSLEEIGGYFGGRDHTTVMHSIRAIDERVQTNADFAAEVDNLDRQLQLTRESS